ncbi:MAG TPA: hypothetical protein VKQ34_02040 [Candidatus Saccharimonadales bacterium]|nr:hypothetical protein [Candidatus Saccharimonadales bacterium]
MVKRTALEQGYVALMAVLILGAAATAIGIVLLTSGTDELRGMAIEQRSKQARGLALACGEEALQQLHDNIAFSTTSGALTLGAGTCTYKVSVNTGTTRTISATGTVGTVTRKVSTTATVNNTTISVSSWKDVADTAGVITHKQTGGTTGSTTSATIAQAFASNTTAGDLIIAAVSWDSATTATMTCSDTQGNTFTTVGVWNDATNTQALSVCYAPNIVGGADTVTAKFGATAGNRYITVSEYSGVLALSPYDKSAGVGGATNPGGTNGASSGSVTPTQNSELVYGAFILTNGSSTITAGTGFTQRFSSLGFEVQDLQQTTAAATASTQTLSVTGDHFDDAVLVLKSAGQ